MSDLVSVRVGGVPEHFNLPWHLGTETGAFSKTGVDVIYTDYPGGTGAMTAALRSDELDVAIVLTEGCVTDILNGNRSRVVKTYVQSPLIWGIHVAASSNIESIEQIRGKRYAISRFGSGSHLMAIVDAAERGWQTEDLEFVVVNNLAGAREALAAGEADIFFWERFTTSPLVASGEFRRIADRETPWPAFVVCARQDFLGQHSDAVHAMLSVINDQCGQLMNSPTAVETIAKRYQLGVEQVQQWFERTRWSADFVKPTDSLTAAIEYLRRLELVPDQPTSADDLWNELTAS